MFQELSIFSIIIGFLLQEPVCLHCSPLADGKQSAQFRAAGAGVCGGVLRVFHSAHTACLATECVRKAC